MKAKTDTRLFDAYRRAKKYGDYLIVALSTDEFNNKKGKKATWITKK